MTEVDYSSKQHDLFENLSDAEAGYGLRWRKTSRDCSAPTMVLHLQGASESYSTAGLVRSAGDFSTVNISEWPNDGAACSLSAILEANPATRYSLSPRACAGILRRAEKRGKELPPMLEEALLLVAGQSDSTQASEPKAGELSEISPLPPRQED